MSDAKSENYKDSKERAHIEQVHKELNDLDNLINNQALFKVNEGHSKLFKRLAELERKEELANKIEPPGGIGICKVVETIVEPKQAGKPEPTTALKLDSGKTEYHYISPIFMEQLSRVLTFGAKKYTAHNWRSGFKWSRVLSACFRHIYAWMGGQDKDPETGISHLAHAACCLMFLLEFEETHRELDDRWKPETKEIVK